ncbi:hypothetical protein CR203_20800 [Salipaludibacillus neizhouensis]|uniref:Uncharacterized protein n=1 Tax=Salipaludibacillus neizhouensis TaxID=885475 RepID=A0A3A9K3D2_9BACI|nr:hypothetical protein CR203_20800 [Salipaludibacillus neizhouensis]
MQTILTNIAIAIVTVFILVYVVDNLMIGIIPLVSLWVVNNYIRELEMKTKVDIKMKKIGTICYFFTVIIGFLIFFL